MKNRQRLTQEIIATGRRLACRGLVTARAGNISCRLNKKQVLITATGSHLGTLAAKNIIAVNLETGLPSPRPTWRGRGGPVASSELPLHRAIYHSFADTAIVHCHPAFINAYFCIYPEIKYLTFESRYYLGEVPVVEQQSLTVTDPVPVIAALKRSGLVVLRNHGIFSRSHSLASALERIEILEEAVRVYALARLFSKKKPDALDKELKKTLSKSK
jgi:L-fuculose-phosphate aldolase